MTDIRSAAVIGLGLIGGSLARDLAAEGVRVIGHDADAASVTAARREGVIAGEIGDDPHTLEQVDVVVLALPVQAALTELERLAPALGDARLITDVGSTKGSIVAQAQRLGHGARFVGSHPLAGDHRARWAASRTRLFDGATVFLCPARETSEAALHIAHDLWRAVGAEPRIIDAAEHDRRLAWISHTPQLLSTALAGTLAEAGYSPADLGTGGRDMTRLAASDPRVWSDIALDNAPALLACLDATAAQLAVVRLALEERDVEALRRWFTAGREWAGGGG